LSAFSAQGCPDRERTTSATLCFFLSSKGYG
jgi:hypothetical protein